MQSTVPMQQDGQVTQEVLEAGPRGGRRPGRRPAFWWTLGIAYLVVFSLVASTALVLFAAQTLQADRLITAVEGSERAMGVVQRQVGDVFEELDAEDLTEQQRRELIDELKVIATEGEIAIAEAGERIEQVRIWPINTRLERARETYLRHNVAWVDYMARAAEDPAQFVSPQPEVNDSFFDARAPLWEAIPALDLLDLQARLRVIYAEPEGGGGGGTQA